MIEVREGRLQSDGAVVDPARVIGFHERYDRLTGKAWLEVIGAGLTVPMDKGYGDVRKALREAFADRPFTSDWSDGAFPNAPLGLPGDLAFTVAATVVLIASVGTTWALGPLAGIGVAVALGWPAVRLRDTIRVHRDGIAAGPAWSAASPWHEVQGLSAVVSGRRAIVTVRTVDGARDATIPTVLLPALKARVGRLGGLPVQPPLEDGLDETYARWREPALGIPWGVLAGALIVAPFLGQPWRTVAIGLLACAATALLGAGVSARASGWGAGGVWAITGVYAIVLAAIGLALGGW